MPLSSAYLSATARPPRPVRRQIPPRHTSDLRAINSTLRSLTGRPQPSKAPTIANHAEQSLTTHKANSPLTVVEAALAYVSSLHAVTPEAYW
jgi:hypothetical protein